MNTEIIFVLDSSGSMSRFRDATLGDFNSMIEKQKSEKGLAKWTTVIFNQTMELLHDAADIKEVNFMASKDYLPRGRTALFDAVGSSINLVSERTNKEGFDDNYDNTSRNKVIFIVMTDGLENASCKFTQADVNRMIAEKKTLGWEFIYLGANVTDVRDAEGMGIKSDKRYYYNKVEQSEVYEGVSLSISSYRKNHRLPDTWKENMKTCQIDLPFLDFPEGFFIVDTGSPTSFGIKPVLRIRGKNYNIGHNPIIRDVQKNLGGHIKGLLGMDILIDYDLEIRFDDVIHKFQVDLNDSVKPRGIDYEDAALKVEFLMGVPVISATLKETERKFFLDSGSSISYMRDSLVDKSNICGRKKDFYPLLGSFFTNLFSADLNLMGDDYKLEVGLLPDMLQGLLPQEIDGILGSDFIKFAPLKLGFQSKEFKLLEGGGK